MAPNARTPRKILIAAAVAGVGALGVGVAGAVGGIPISPGPSDNAGSHSAPEATTVSLPDAASAGSGNASASAAAPADVQAPASDPGVAASTPGVGEAPSESELSTALAATEGTPGNTVLNDLINTAPGSDRGATISGDAQELGSANADSQVPEQASSHRP